uniref:Uncharacterized protein n=1 Tax=Rhizophora mucronata TaxID=61149 RepID=A0A2P2QRZ4_RHIMU
MILPREKDKTLFGFQFYCGCCVSKICLSIGAHRPLIDTFLV